MKKLIYVIIWTIITSSVSSGLKAQYLGGSGDGFSVASILTNIALPVEWVTFEVAISGDKVNVIWVTARESNTDYFSVEKSHDGNTFYEFERVAASGLSDNPTTYQTIDPDLPTKTIFYRIGQVDLDGKFSFSRVETLTPVFDSWDVKAFPNPGEGSALFLRFTGVEPGTPISMEINDELGRKLDTYFFSIGENGSLIHMEQFFSQMSPGVYHIKLINQENGSSKNIRYVVR